MADASFTEKAWLVFPQYVSVLNMYFIQFSQSAKYSKAKSDNNYILINGINTLTNVFNTILEQTLDPKLALVNMQQSIFYYIPFIDQLEENIMQDLNISSNSASLFVYKKTIGDMAVSLVETINDTQRDFVDNIKSLQNIYRLLFDLTAVLNLTEPISKITPFLIALCNDYSDEHQFKEVLANVKLLLTHLLNTNTQKIYDLLLLYIKHYKHHPITLAGLCAKKTMAEYDEKLKENNIKWLIN